MADMHLIFYGVLRYFRVGSHGWGMGMGRCPGGGTRPISSGVMAALSIITPTPTLAAFCANNASHQPITSRQQEKRA